MGSLNQTTDYNLESNKTKWNTIKNIEKDENVDTDLGKSRAVKNVYLKLYVD